MLGMVICAHVRNFVNVQYIVGELKTVFYENIFPTYCVLNHLLHHLVYMHLCGQDVHSACPRADIAFYCCP